MPKSIIVPDEILEQIESYKNRHYLTDKELAKRLGISEFTFTKIRSSKTSSATTLKKLVNDGIIGLEEDVFLKKGDKANFLTLKMIPEYRRHKIEGYVSSRYYFDMEFYITVSTTDERTDLERKLLKFFLDYSLKNDLSKIKMTYKNVIEANNLNIGIKDISESIYKLFFSYSYRSDEEHCWESVISSVTKMDNPKFDDTFEIGFDLDHLKRFSNYFYW